MTAPLDEKGMLPCPFCGGPVRTFQYNGTTQASCAALHTECAGTDVVAPVAMWNRRHLSAVALPDELEGKLLKSAVDVERIFLHRIDHSGEDWRLVNPDGPAAAALMREAQGAISQAHSTIAALRAERDEAGKLALKQHGRAETYMNAAVGWQHRAETAEAEVKRLTEEKEALERHNQALLDKISSEDCACAYDHPDDVCLGHSPKLQAAEARIKALEEALEPSIEHIDTLVELLKVIKEHWIDYDHVYSIAVHEADDFLSRHKAGSKE